MENLPTKNRQKKTLTAKKVAKKLLIEYYVESKDAEAFKKGMSFLSTKVLGQPHGNYVTRLFTRAELSEIKYAALLLRRQRLAPQLAEIDEALLTAALKGSDRAIRLAYERFEGWSAKNITNFSGNVDTVIVIERSGHNEKDLDNIQVVINQGEKRLKNAKKDSEDVIDIFNDIDTEDVVIKRNGKKGQNNTTELNNKKSSDSMQVVLAHDDKKLKKQSEDVLDISNNTDAKEIITRNNSKKESKTIIDFKKELDAKVSETKQDSFENILGYI